MRSTAYLSLGSNIGNRAGHIADAVERLAKLGTLASASSLYETQPVDVIDQPWFLNCVVELKTSKSPEQLLKGLLSIEQAMGRFRSRRKGPRIIDLDILLFDDLVLDTLELKIPHREMHKRRFVLVPLAEIAPDLVHPMMGGTIAELRDALPAAHDLVKLHREAGFSVPLPEKNNIT